MTVPLSAGSKCAVLHDVGLGTGDVPGEAKRISVARQTQHRFAQPDDIEPGNLRTSRRGLRHERSACSDGFGTGV